MKERHLPRHIAAYLAKQVIHDQWYINEQPVASYRGAVVIPSLAEYHNLPHTLQSLSTNSPELLARFLILVVVNQRADASPAEQADNQATLAALPAWRQEYGLEHLRWVDAASPGHELPHKQGVGLARKIGLDLALHHLEFKNHDPLMICLDADTIVQPDYLTALAGHFESATAGGASLPYRHRAAANPEGQAAIDRYELFLRAYVLGLEQAGSPWAFHTVGSAMASRASAYVSSGGMNRRLAGEDFYFLQQVHKTAEVAPLSGTTVHPSPRSSHRVPFGTGRAVGDMLNKGEQQLLFYQPQLFGILGEWLDLVTDNSSSSDGEELGRAAGSISPHLESYLEQTGFRPAWDNLRRHNPDQSRLMNAFHCWFDAFRTMRLMHHLTDCAWPRVAPEDAVGTLLVQAGYDGIDTISSQLEILRRMQGS